MSTAYASVLPTVDGWFFPAIDEWMALSPGTSVIVVCVMGAVKM